MRHAKSSWAFPELDDHQRPLTKRGVRSATLIAEQLAALDWEPDRVCSSTAQRTRETWEAMATIFSPDIDVEYFDSLYHGGVTDILPVLESVDMSSETVLLLGHNPGWEAFASHLAGQHFTLKTADAVLLETSVSSWREAVMPGHAWYLQTFLAARTLYDADKESRS